MEPRKYSTGTKGRIKMHCATCKEFIRAHTSFSLAAEFIDWLDPEHDEASWQRFQKPADILPELQSWLGGEVAVPAPPSGPVPSAPGLKGLRLASQIPVSPEDAAFKRTREWLADPSIEEKLQSLSPGEAAEMALARFRQELARRA
jgi:hypothetical protein